MAVQLGPDNMVLHCSRRADFNALQAALSKAGSTRGLTLVLSP
jgi:hypothetical protein